MAAGAQQHGLIGHLDQSRLSTLNLDLGIICDCALIIYHFMHDGVLQADGDVDNDATIAILAQQAVAPRQLRR